MTPYPQGRQTLIAAFNRQPCWKIQPLAEQLAYSVPSVRRFLAQVGYLSSFTHNGAWYTLSSIPAFNAQGLWFYQQIGFSKAGSLTNTLVALAHGSSGGLTAEQLTEKLGCRCHGVLVHLCRQGRLQRQKDGRTYRYLSADADIARRQLQRLEPGPLPAEIAIWVLAQFIRKPRSSWQQLAQDVSARMGLPIEPRQVQALFAHLGLKKTTSAARPRPLAF